MTDPSFAPDSDSSSPELSRVAAAESEAFRYDVDAVLKSWFQDQRTVADGISEAAGPMVEAIAGLSTGGKRTRAQLLYWSWRAAGGDADSRIPRLAGAGIELFQTAALIHDDIIDRSATRRGMRSIHVLFADRHRDSGWSQDSAHFGTSAAVLAGDLALTWSEQIFGEAVALAGHPAGAAADFTRMRTEVMLGQYLDIHAEVAPAVGDPEEQLERAMTVLRYKSAKYSVEHPVEIGAALAGADREFLADCSAFALPVGEAFQLRDDVLGVFGDPETTGKPAGDDIREGKRTALIALCAASSSTEDIAWLESVLGRAELTEQEVHRARDLMRDSGAHARSEELIASLVRTADTQLARLRTDDVARAGLQALAGAAVRRAK